MLSLAAQIEALLFFRGDPVSISWLSKTLRVHENKIEQALDELSEALEGRGVTLVRSKESVTMTTRKEMAVVFEEIRKGELEEDLTKAAVEVLSVIMYSDGATKKEIDYVRGVNSQISLRNLASRGLIRRGEEGRGTKYEPTTDLLRFLGISELKELPQFDEFNAGIKEAVRIQIHE